VSLAWWSCWWARLRLDSPLIQAEQLLIYRVLLRDQPAIADLVQSVLGQLVRARGGAEPLLTIPVLPFLLRFEGVTAVVAAAVPIGRALMATGRALGVLSGGPPLRRALRRLVIGPVAGAVTAGVTYRASRALWAWDSARRPAKPLRRRVAKPRRRAAQSREVSLITCLR
jgi:hypothetical protein